MEWISLKDRVPTEEECKANYGWFLVARDPTKGWIKPEISRYDGHDPDHSYDHGWKYGWDVMNTHWMPLPELPKSLEDSEDQ